MYTLNVYVGDAKYTFSKGGVRGSVERAASTAADCERRKTIIIGINLLNFNLSKMKKKKKVFKSRF